MNKENRKLAQQQRAAVRKRKQKRDQLEKNFMITMVVAIILMLALFIGFDILMSDDVGNGQNGDSQTNTTLQSDTELTVEDGDKIHIDFVGSVDGVEFEGGNTEGEGVDLWVGSGSMIDDFEEQLIGAHPGDTVDVYVTFPDDYEKAPDLEGKEALFKVTIHGIYR